MCGASSPARWSCQKYSRPSVPLIVVPIFEGVMCLVSDPWGGPGVRSLLSGKMELQQQVLELVSAEGVDLVLLRVGRGQEHHCAIAVALSIVNFFKLYVIQ